ncbi:hypothetical protein ACP275_14G031900 [Erythranthe tilingii]
MAKAAFHLHHRTFLLLRTQTNPLRHSNRRSISISDHRFLLRLLSSPPLHVSCSSRRWDSNAESYNSKNLNFDDNDETQGFYDSTTEQWDVFDEYIDSIWIFKVFSSFGWMLPVIIASLLLANGPKAFLMALALPLGQSTFAFAIQKYQDRGKTKTKAKPVNVKTKNRSSRSYKSRNSKLEEVAEWIGRERSRKKKNKKKNNNGYQSWVSKNEVNSMSSVDRSQSDFGGWDEFDERTGFYEESSRRESRESIGLEENLVEKKENKGLSEDYGPSLLKLLVSIFPFLSSWMKVL